MNDDVLVPMFAFFVIGWVTWVVFSSIRRYLTAKFQTNLQMKMLEKIDSGETAVAYAQTEAGREFLKSLAVERAEGGSPYRNILSGVRAGIMLLAFGIAVLSLRSLSGDAVEAGTLIGRIAIALGIGFELAAGATYFLSRSFGLLSREVRS